MKCSISSAGSVLYMARCCTIKRNLPVKQRLWNF
jgi:hypothetical protein